MKSRFWKNEDYRQKRKLSVFTIVELLVVISIIMILAGLLMPALGKAKEQGRSTACLNNIKQIHLANSQYCSTYGSFVPARSGGYTSGQHWHGYRASSSVAWDGTKGLLVEYLGKEGKIKKCPSSDFNINETVSSATAGNMGCGGYGYNYAGVGGQSYILGYPNWTTGSSNDVWLAGMRPEKIADQSKTVMFGDAAHLSTGGKLVENDELNSPYSLYNATPAKAKTKKPTADTNYSKVHFRHNNNANIVWVDGHASTEKMAYSWTYQGGDTPDDARMKLKLGFFGPKDNSLYDPWTDSIPEE